MPKIAVRGIKLHYIALGQGPDMIMIHGFLGNLAVWHLHIAPELRHQFRVTTYDLRGHGYSEVTPKGYSAENQALDLKDLMDSLSIEKASIVGHSFGADIGLYMSLLYPERVRRLVAIEPGLAALVDQRKSAQWNGWSYWVSKLEEVGLEVPPDKRTDVDYLLKLSLETPKFYGPARGLPRNREPLLNLIHNTTLLQDYEEVGSLTLEAVRRVNTPTLLVYGENSNFLETYHFLTEALPNCTPLLLEGGEHFGPLEQPEDLKKHISEFLGQSGENEGNNSDDIPLAEASS